MRMNYHNIKKYFILPSFVELFCTLVTKCFKCLSLVLALSTLQSRYDYDPYSTDEQVKAGRG